MSTLMKVIVTLTNGLRVGNFSSPHPFNFTDGTLLPPASDEDVKRGSLDVKEIEYENEMPFTDIELQWNLSESCKALLLEWFEIYKRGEVDVVLIPFPVKGALSDYARVESVNDIIAGDDAGPTHDELRELACADGLLREQPFRVIRVADRKTKAICIDKFCI